MEETIEIPDLLHPYLMELSVCAKLRTKKKALLSKLAKLRPPIVATLSKSSGMYAQVFGGGQVKEHLHVDVMLRPPDWKAKSELRPLASLQSALGQFIGSQADVIVSGEFLVERNELPKDHFIRAAKKRMKIGGTSAERTGESFVLSTKPYRALRWSDFGDGYVLVALEFRFMTEIERDYLLKSKVILLNAFHSLVLAE